MTTPYYFQVGYLKLGVATAPSDTPTINIINLADGALLVTGASVTKQGNMAGLCTYVYNGAANLNLIGLVHSTDATVDCPDLHSIGVISLAGSTGGITVAEIFDYLVSNIVTANSIGKLLKDMLNATVGSRATPADVTVNATVAVSQAVAQTVSSGSLAVEAGYTLRQSVTSTSTSALNTATNVKLAIKRTGDADSASLVYIDTTTGLKLIDGAAYATPAHGSLTVSGSSGAWSIAIYLDEVASALLLGKNDNYIAGIKATIGADEVSIWTGAALVSDGVVRTNG